MTRTLSFAIVVCLIGRATGAYGGSPSLNFGPPYIITGSFSRPFGLGIDATHNRLLVADTGNNRVKWSDLTTLSASPIFNEFGYVVSRSDPAALTDPQGVASDAAGNVYVVNTLGGQVVKFNWSGGTYAVDLTFCNSNSHVVAGIPISFPRDIAVGPDGAVYLLDSGNKRILKAASATATAWSVFYSDGSWSNPYGLAIDGSGKIYVADTYNHRIVVVTGAAVTQTFGTYGTGDQNLRYPRDVAVDTYGRIFVADTYNHRIVVLASDGHLLRKIGEAPAIGTVEKIVVDTAQRVIAVDSDANDLVAFLGAGRPPPFDFFVRDFVGDNGSEPSNASFTLSSADLLVRHHPDIDLANPPAGGLESFIFEDPIYNRPNYVYVAVHNRGTQPATDGIARLYWVDPASGLHFPADWNQDGFYRFYSSPSHNTAGDALQVPPVPPGGVAYVGPLVWLPPAPESVASHDGVVRLSVRVGNSYDQPPTGSSTTMVRDSNDVTDRRANIQRLSSTGEQNTLVLSVLYPDLSSTIDGTTVHNTVAAMAAWVQKVSYGTTTITPAFDGPVTLPHPTTYYTASGMNVLVELAHDALDAILSSNPHELDGSGPGHEITRVLIVTNDLTSPSDWATTGTWPYTNAGVTRYLTVSVQGAANPAEFFSHAVSHQLNLVDLYNHEHIVFPRPYADGWDNMAKPFNGAHPLVWSKQLATWVTSSGAQIVFVPRPAPGTTWNNSGSPIGIHYQETAVAGQVVGVAFGLTYGVTVLSDETAFYYVEARSNSASADSVLPQTGVLMYYANARIPQGQGPVILRNHVPGPDLTHAAIPIGGTEAPAGTGISVTVQAGTNGADYNLSLRYNPPTADYDAYMHPGPGNPAVETPDIWTDNQRDGPGYDEDYGRPPQDRGEQPIAGEENRIYAHVFNHGPGTAYDVEAAFQLSAPWHTVGGQDAFDEYRSVFIDQIAGGSDATAYVPWTPVTGVDPHSCVRVELRRLFNDTDSTDNVAQKNFWVDHSVHGSPYSSVDFTFQYRHKQPDPKLVYYRVEGVPSDWAWSVTPPKAFVDPGTVALATVHLQPPPTALDCTQRRIQITAWSPGGDTLVPQGGVRLSIDLQQKTNLRTETSITHCQELAPTNKARTPLFLKSFSSPAACLGLETRGCTAPPRPGQVLSVRVIGPAGVPQYDTVTTNASGCFDDITPVVEGGNWQVDTYYAGDTCSGPASSHQETQIPLPVVRHPERGLPNPDAPLCVQPLSADVRGEIRDLGRSARWGCQKGSHDDDEKMLLHLSLPVVPQKTGYSLDGDLELIGLHEARLDGEGAQPGYVEGKFIWRGTGFAALGLVNGISQLGSHRPPGSASCGETGAVPRHRELQIDGMVVEGRGRGSRIRATLALDESRTSSPERASLLRGVLEGVTETRRGASESTVAATIVQARASFDQGMPTCGPGLPCLSVIHASGRGTSRLDMYGDAECEGAQRACESGVKSCPIHKTWQAIEVRLDADTNGAAAKVSGTLVVPKLISIVDPATTRGEHVGKFTWKTGEGTIEGTLLGLNAVGSHRAPSAHACESAIAKNHLEGRLYGSFTAGSHVGGRIEARYTLLFTPPKSGIRRQEVGMTLVGFRLDGCDRSLAPVVVGKTTLGRTQPPAKFVPPPETAAEPPPAALYGAELRPLEGLPKDAVAAYSRAAGGKLSPTDALQLRTDDVMFRRLDTRRRGFLDRGDFERAFGEGNKQGSPARAIVIKRLLARFDRNRNGEIDKTELGPDWTRFSQLDVDRNGSLSVRELERALPILADREFEAVDTNRDGKVDFTEFSLWMRVQPPASRPNR